MSKDNQKKCLCQAFSALVNSAYVKAGNKIEVFENAVTIQNDSCGHSRKPEVGAKRGAIHNFSTASRRRLLRLFSKTNVSLFSNMFFVTLTYHFENSYKDHSSNDDINLFLTNLRQKLPRFFYIWRLEFQKRGAPHYHIALFFPHDSVGYNFSLLSKDVAETWNRIANPNSKAARQYAVKVDKLTSYRNAVAYLSKYVAKEDTEINPKFSARRWAASRDLPVVPIFSCNVSIDIVHQFRRIVRRFLKSQKVKSRKFIDYVNSCNSIHLFMDSRTSIRLLEFLIMNDPFFIRQKIIESSALTLEGLELPHRPGW